MGVATDGNHTVHGLFEQLPFTFRIKRRFTAGGAIGLPGFQGEILFFKQGSQFPERPVAPV